MSNVTINQLPAANTVDPVNDLLPIFQNSSSSTLSISRNTLLGLSSAPVGLSDSQTLTNKILTSPTISGPTFSGTLAGTYIIGGTPTFPSSVVQLTAIQTLTNKTLTSPTINSPIITNANLTTDSISGFTVANSLTIAGLSIASGVITTSNSVSGSALTDNSVGSSKIQVGAVGASQLSTSAILAGKVTFSSSQSVASATFAQVPGFTLSFTFPSSLNSRVALVLLTATVQQNGAGQNAYFSVWDGTVGSGTQLVQVVGTAPTSGALFPIAASTIITPTPGASKTYNVGVHADGVNFTALRGDLGPATLSVILL